MYFGLSSPIYITFNKFSDRPIQHFRTTGIGFLQKSRIGIIIINWVHLLSDYIARIYTFINKMNCYSEFFFVVNQCPVQYVAPSVKWKLACMTINRL